MRLGSLLLLFLALLAVCMAVEGDMSEYSIVTLVSGTDVGYVSGAIALGQSLIDSHSLIPKTVMVTSEVSSISRERMSKVGWHVQEVETILCNHKTNLPEGQYDMSSERFQAGIKRWSTTCTKFQAFNPYTYTLNENDDSLTTKRDKSKKKNGDKEEALQYKKRVIFMDSDMLVLHNIDALLNNETYRDSLNLNSHPHSLAAAPEGFPPDTFNAGFMVFTPSHKIYERLLRLNREVGSTEGGDQGILNYGLCPRWFLGPSSTPSLSVSDSDIEEEYHCARLPWIYNVQAAAVREYDTVQTMSFKPTSAVAHFVSDGKPWQVILLEYHPAHRASVSLDTKMKLGGQAALHAQWRDCYFRATGEQRVENKFLVECVQLVQSSRQSGSASGNVSDEKEEKEEKEEEKEEKQEEKQEKKKEKHEEKMGEGGQGKKRVRLSKRKKEKGKQSRDKGAEKRRSLDGRMKAGLSNDL